MATPSTSPVRRTTDPMASDGDGSVPGSRRSILALGLVALALGLSANSVLGPLLLDAIEYPVSDSMRNQTIGLDAASLFVIAPACLLVATLARRGHRLAPLLTVSLGGYVTYMFLQYLVGPQFDHYPGVLVLQLGLFIGGWMLAALAWPIVRRQFRSTAVLSQRHAGAALAMAGFVLLRYIPGLAASLTQEPLPDEVSGDVTMYWLIVVSDLGVFVPLVLAIAVAIRQGASWAGPALAAAVGWFTMVSVAVGTMSLTMVINDDRFASRAQLGLFVVTTAVVAGYAIQLHRMLFTTARPGPT